jgi:phosphatidylinositol alpha-mannosyltransferase
MKIGLVIDDRISRPGGVQEYVLGLADYLKKKGHQPIIFTSGRYTKKQKRKRKIISFGKTFDLPGDAQKGIPITFGQGKKIKRILAKERPEILHVQGPPGPLGLGFLQNSNSVNVITFHVAHEVMIADFLIKQLSPLWKKFDKKIHGRIAISKVAEDYARKFSPGPFKIIPVGVDLNRFRPKAPTMGQFKDKRINLLFVGRLDKRKGVEYLLKAYQRLSQIQPEIRLIIIGDGPQKKKAKDYVKEEKLKEVVFAGQVSPQDLPSFYATADIFCSPATHGESLGVVLLEAMATGLPVVAFDNPGYQKVFPDFGKGFLVPKKNVSALTQALLILATNPNLKKELGRKNRDYAQQFSWEKVGKEILKFYQTCRTKHKPKASLALTG